MKKWEILEQALNALKKVEKSRFQKGNMGFWYNESFFGVFKTMCLGGAWLYHEKGIKCEKYSNFWHRNFAGFVSTEDFRISSWLNGNRPPEYEISYKRERNQWWEYMNKKLADLKISNEDFTF